MQDYIVKDIALADYGRKEIDIAETEMPGLMACREEFGEAEAAEGRAHRRLAAHDDPDRRADRDAEGARRRRALGLLQHLLDPGPRRRGDRRRPARRSSPIKGESLEEYWTYTDRIFQWPDGEPSNMILDDGGDATHVHPARRARRGGRGRPVQCRQSEEEEVLFAQIKKRMAATPGWFTKQRDAIKGVTEETTTGVNRLYQLQKKGLLPFPAINVNDCVTKSKFDNKYGCKESLVDGIRRAHRRDDGRQGRRGLRLRRCRQGLRRIAARRRRPREGDRGRPDLRAAGGDGRLRGRARWKMWSPTADIFVTTTGNKDVIRIEHMREMKDMAIVGNIGHFDNEIQVAALRNHKWTNIKPQVDMIEFPGRQADDPAVRRAAC